MAVRRRAGRISLYKPVAFWVGMGAATAGVLLHLPMYAAARDNGYRLVGMGADGAMQVGMALVVVGLCATAYGLVPTRAEASARGRPLRVKALDEAPISAAHVGLLLVMAAAVTIDVMKPVTLSFVVPGMAEEYGLKSAVNPGGGPPVAWLPFAGITGTVFGSFIWGWLGDRIGRRASILFAGVLFVVTSICGSMPSYQWNFVMCFVMGLGVGGMLPITFTLMAEMIPARHRGWLMVLIGGDVVGAYIITSWLAAGLIPTFGWRIMWLLGFPTGLLLIWLIRWIPESPRFLIRAGRDEEASAVMSRYGIVALEEEHSELEVESSVKDGWLQLFGRPFAGMSSVLVLLGFGVGLVTFGFQLWIPSNLEKLGFGEVTSATILRDSALLGFPVTFVVAWLYGFWSSRRTIIVLSLVTAASLIGLAVAGEAVADNRLLLKIYLLAPITGISSILAVLVAYASEVFPTRIRSRGTGLIAGASKLAGVGIIGLVLLGATTPSITTTAIIGAVPLGLSGLVMVFVGVETARRRLEDITRVELDLVRNPGGEWVDAAPGNTGG